MPRALWLIVSNTLSGTGLGLLAWLGVSIALLHMRATTMDALHMLYAWALAVGVVLVALGAWGGMQARLPAHASAGKDAVTDLPGAAQPTAGWRAWRTSWRARALLATAATLLLAILAIAILVGVPRGPTSATVLALVAMAMAIAALAAATSSAMRFGGELQVPAWRHLLVLPLQLLCVLFGGLAVLFAAMALVLPGNDGVTGMLGTLAWLGLLLVAGSLAWWLACDRAPGMRPADAQARPHPRRWLAGALLLGVPLAGLGLAIAGVGHGAALLVCVALAIQVGIGLWQGLLVAHSPTLATAAA